MQSVPREYPGSVPWVSNLGRVSTQAVLWVSTLGMVSTQSVPWVSTLGMGSTRGAPWVPVNTEVTRSDRRALAPRHMPRIAGRFSLLLSVDPGTVKTEEERMSIDDVLEDVTERRLVNTVID